MVKTIADWLRDGMIKIAVNNLVDSKKGTMEEQNVWCFWVSQGNGDDCSDGFIVQAGGQRLNAWKSIQPVHVAVDDIIEVSDITPKSNPSPTQSYDP